MVGAAAGEVDYRCPGDLLDKLLVVGMFPFQDHKLGGIRPKARKMRDPIVGGLLRPCHGCGGYDQHPRRPCSG